MGEQGKDVEYTVLIGYSLDQLEDAVMEFLGMGFEPLGGVAVDNDRHEKKKYLQAMISRGDPDSEPAA